MMDDDTSGRDHPVHHVSGLYSETHKDATDKGEIGESEIQQFHHGEIDVSPQSHQHKSVPSSSTQPERTSKLSLDGDEIKNYINKCGVNAVDKEASREDDFENEDCSDLKALEDEVGGTITDSIQVAVDTILFSLSTPSTTKPLDVSDSNKMTERQWDLPNRQIPPGFLDAQVRELEASKSKALAKRERKKSSILRSPYILKYGSASQDADDYDKEEKIKYAFDGYTINQDLSNKLMIDYSQWIPVGLLKIHSVKYTTISCFFKTYVEKMHTHYYPAELAVEQSTQQDYTKSIVVAKNEDAIANIIHGFCMPAGLPWYMVDEVYVPINCSKKFHWTLAVIVLKERLIHVYDSLSNNGFYDNTERTDWPSLEVYKEKITQQRGLVNEIPFDVDYMQNIPQQVFGSLNLSEGLQVHSCGFDATSQRVRYASLLWHYGVKKANEGYTSDNDDPPRPRKSVIEEIDASEIVTLE
ncbi:hypothetical protein CQW23_01339 [Capsicum baccatum]|uniref:Ubiquitin-like protease family profile domain-containing protein n=1 Tax=Capsicum baccatum TaxID=33114 RepID=A0A2G2XN99_CAPBA|nr:hypothetical protein CQW23_01339 [Capsicum baccatum]